MRDPHSRGSARTVRAPQDRTDAPMTLLLAAPPAPSTSPELDGAVPSAARPLTDEAPATHRLATAVLGAPAARAYLAGAPRPAVRVRVELDLVSRLPAPVLEAVTRSADVPGAVAAASRLYVEVRWALDRGADAAAVGEVVGASVDRLSHRESVLALHALEQRAASSPSVG